MRKNLLVLTLLLASCATPLPQPVPSPAATLGPVTNALAGPGSTPQPRLAPLDAPEQRPYQAPAFADLPPEAQAGRWERVEAGSQPTPEPVPTPVPTPTPLPGLNPNESPAIGFGFESKALVLAVGAAFTLSGYDENRDQQRQLTWGTLDADHATVSADGQLTARAPGAVRIYADAGDRRKYAMAAVVAPGLAARTLPIGPTAGSDEAGTWTTVLRSQADLDAVQPALRLYVPPSPLDVDFGRENVLVLRIATTDDFQGTPVVTSIEGGTVHVVVPEAARDVCSCDPHTNMVAVALPALPADVHVELDTLYAHTSLALSPVTGATPRPQPSPSPTPTPDPFTVLPADAPTRPPMPPYPPPNPAQQGDCPGPDQMDARVQPPLSLNWYGAPLSGAPTWQPFLTPGSSFQLFAQNSASPVRWTSADPRILTVDADGRLTGVHAGQTLVTASNAAGSRRALIPVVPTAAPALRFRFKADWGTPSDQAQRGARIIRDAAAWQSLWQHDLFYTLPWAPPAVDFSRYDVVALVDDRSTYAESDPVITAITTNATLVHLTFPGLESQGGAYHRWTYLFLTGKLDPAARVQVHTLCNP